MLLYVESGAKISDYLLQSVEDALGSTWFHGEVVTGKTDVIAFARGSLRDIGTRVLRLKTDEMGVGPYAKPPASVWPYIIDPLTTFERQLKELETEEAAELRRLPHERNTLSAFIDLELSPMPQGVDPTARLREVTDQVLGVYRPEARIRLAAKVRNRDRIVVRIDASSRSSFDAAIHGLVEIGVVVSTRTHLIVTPPPAPAYAAGRTPVRRPLTKGRHLAMFTEVRGRGSERHAAAIRNLFGGTGGSGVTTHQLYSRTDLLALVRKLSDTTGEAILELMASPAAPHSLDVALLEKVVEHGPIQAVSAFVEVTLESRASSEMAAVRRDIRKLLGEALSYEARYMNQRKLLLGIRAGPKDLGEIVLERIQADPRVAYTRTLVQVERRRRRGGRSNIEFLEQHLRGARGGLTARELRTIAVQAGLDWHSLQSNALRTMSDDGPIRVRGTGDDRVYTWRDSDK